MSEQPKVSSMYVPEQEPINFDTTNADDGVQLDLHRNITVPKYDPEVIAAGRRAFEQPKAVVEISSEAMEVRAIARLLEDLNTVRMQYRKDLQSQKNDYELAA